MHLCSTLLSDAGTRKTRNEDAAVALPDLGLFVVADGMGGYQGGEFASRIAVQVIAEYIGQGQAETGDGPETLLHEAILAANFSIYQRSLREPQLIGMGTTVTALLFRSNHLWIGHVGDSRCYLIRGPEIRQLTQDHSVAYEKLAAGQVTLQEIQQGKVAMTLTRAVGFEEKIEVDQVASDVQPGDAFLVCTDGLSGFLEGKALLRAIQSLREKGATDEKIVVRLIELAKGRGSEDNITALLIRAHS